jgi:hypothetical protein
MECKHVNRNLEHDFFGRDESNLYQAVLGRFSIDKPELALYNAHRIMHFDGK